ncbi:MAG TPA: hypothetical protein PL151_20610 [Phycisphaerae bacterium]|nr:hypothetical protein [Phycisphaerae bacterium]HOJ72872.1 hypothetical protein [Phycisphaerae bacterium]HOM51701.1 hypothetical protein [Phycisphaerae bacterium]HON66904.1 hypothetical protein [Phycisphaerae bacterium]HOQ86996.1 hypothetical protein [Phycisphaerae bacterium]
MTSKTLTIWHLPTTSTITHVTWTVTHVMCAQQAANAIKVYFRGLCCDGDDGP